MPAKRARNLGRTLKLVHFLQNHEYLFLPINRDSSMALSMAAPQIKANGYKNILDSLTTAILVLGDGLRIEYLNPAAESLFETSITRSQGLPIRDILADSEDALTTLHAAADNGHSYTRREAEFVLTSGSRLTVDYSVSPINLSPVELLIEIQPRDRLLRISREEDIISQQETTRILVRGMAHEIKNPLGGIRGAAQLLDRELSDGDQREYTQVIIAEADRLRSLVDRMLGPNSETRPHQHS